MDSASSQDLGGDPSDLIQVPRASVPGVVRRDWTRVNDAIKRGIIGFYRQSSMIQARRNTGSQKAQEEQAEHLRVFGVNPDQVEVILAYGESGREGVVRKKFAELLARVRADTVGLVLLARHDRIGRNTVDAQELFQAMREKGVIIMVDGRIYDPSDDADAFILSIYAEFAQWENRARARWLALSSYAKARTLSYRVVLPTGLVWADPEDPEYRQRAIEAGMEDALATASEQKVASRVGDATLRILPYPDAEVIGALRLQMEWLLETAKVSTVVHRIREGAGGWTRPGLVPIQRGWRFPLAQVVWVRADKARVYDALRSPALYGTYRFRPHMLNGDRRPPSSSRKRYA